MRGSAQPPLSPCITFNFLQFESDFLPALVLRPLDDEGEAAVAGAVHLEVVVAAVPHQPAVRARPQRRPPRPHPIAVVALAVAVWEEDEHEPVFYVFDGKRVEKEFF